MNKKLLHSLIALLASMQIAFAAKAEAYYKEIRKSIQVDPTARLDIDINFANINIQTWDNPSMEIVVKIDVAAKDQRRADEMFEQYQVSISEGRELVTLTVGTGKWSCGSGKSAESISTNVEVKMPIKAIIDGRVAFGDVSIADMLGACLLNVEYGGMQINGLWSYDNDIRIAFGDATIRGTNGGDFRNEYGSMQVDLLQGNAEISASFGDLKIKRVTKECKDLDLEIEYADAEIGIALDAGFSITAKAAYGDLDFPNDLKVTSVKEDYTSKEVRAVYGSGAGKLAIECDFGDVEIDIE